MTTLMTYRQIADELAERITSGEYQPGAKLPSYTELAELYSVSVSTASRAYAVLHVRGLIEGAHGRGVFVADSTSAIDS